MRSGRPLLAVLACVLLATTAAVPALSAADPAPARSAPGADAVLTVETPDRSGFANQSIDVSTALAMGHTRADASLDRRTLEVAFERATTEAERRRLLVRATERLDANVGALATDAGALRRAYLDRRIDTAAYVRGLARIDTRARTLERRIASVSRLADRISGTPLQDRLAILRAALEGYTGPVRQRVATATRGTAVPTRTYAIVGPNGTALSMLTDGRHVREAHRPDRQTPGVDPDYGINEVIEQLPTLYPSFASNTPGFGVIGLPEFNPQAYYRLDIGFPDRTVEAYLDTGSRAVFHEVQTRPLAAPTGNRTAIGVANGTRLVVNRTYPGGPLRIVTYDNATGEPVPATVAVAGREVATGADGTVWVLGPRVGFRVTAVRDGGTVSVLVSPVEPVPVGGTTVEG